MRVVLYTLAICMLFFVSVIPAQEELSAEGTGSAVNQDNALNLAKRNALEKAISQIIVSRIENDNFQLKRDQVLPKAVTTIKSAQIIEEIKNPEGLVQIKLKVGLQKDALKEILKSFQVLIESMEKPKVMIIVDENNINSKDPENQAAESAILSSLKGVYNFDVVDPQVLVSIKSSKQKMTSITENPVEAAAIASQYGAEVLVTGTAVSKKTDNQYENSALISVQADVILKAINCSTGRIIGSTSERMIKQHLSPQTAGAQAISSASEKCVNKLLDAIIKDWQNQVKNGLPLSITVNGVLSLRVKSSVVATMKMLTGVYNVQEKDWDSKNGVLTINLQYSGNSNGFCSKIDGYKLKAGGGSFAVTGINGQNIILAAKAM